MKSNYKQALAEIVKLAEGYQNADHEKTDQYWQLVEADKLINFIHKLAVSTISGDDSEEQTPHVGTTWRHRDDDYLARVVDVEQRQHGPCTVMFRKFQNGDAYRMGALNCMKADVFLLEFIKC